MAVDLDLWALPHFESVAASLADAEGAVGRFYAQLVASFERSGLNEATRRSLLRCAKRVLLCPECRPGNLDPGRVIQGYALVQLVGCPSCVKRYARAALAQGFTHDQLANVLTLVSGLQAAAALLHAHASSRPASEH